MRHRRWLAWILLLGATIRAPAETLSFEENLPAEAVPVSKPLRLIGDSQIHEFYGVPTFLSSLVADRLSEVAIRPSQQRVFATQMLAAAIADERIVAHDTPIIHLGDAMDVSCVTEWRRFLEVMNAGTAPWTLMPGNHDGYFVGNLYPKEFEDPEESTRNFFSAHYGAQGWIYRCGPSEPVLTKERGAAPLGKEALIRRYLETRAPSLKVNERCANGDCDFSGEHGSSSRLFAHISTTEPWTSYLMQAVDLTSVECLVGKDACLRVIMILLDTSTYAERPKFFRHPAGITGGIGAGQLELLGKWVDEYTAQNAVVILAGHHPFQKVKRAKGAARLKYSTLKEVLCRKGGVNMAPALYISAHTHRGWWRVHDCGGGNEVAELNVGSVLDWPAHLRSLQLFRALDGRIFIHSQKSDFASVQQHCESSWIPAADDERFKEQQKLKLNWWRRAVVQSRIALNLGLRADLLEYRALHRIFPTRIVPNTRNLNISTSDEAITRINIELANLTPEKYESADSRTNPEHLLDMLRADEPRRQVAQEKRRQAYYLCLASWAAAEDRERQDHYKEPTPAAGTLSRDLTTVTVSGRN